MTEDTRATVAALRHSHERLKALVEPMDEAALRGPSYDIGWSIAQVLGHLGSGSEIFAAIVDAALAGEELPGPESFPPVWDSWNAKSDSGKAEDWRRVDAAFVERVEHLDDQELATPVSLFGMQVDVAGIVRMRLSEHALHTWDVAVARDRGAQVDGDAADILIDQLAPLAARVGKPNGHRFRLAVHTVAPERAFVLDVGDGVEMTPGDGSDNGVDGHLEMPSEALVRLAAGRLDPAHTPAGVQADGVALDEVRAVFPGL